MDPAPSARLLWLPGARRRKSGGVLDDIGQQIVGGTFAPGEVLPTEAELAERFAVSRSSLREALWALAQKGLIEARARRGTQVLGKDHWDLLDPDVLRWMATGPPDPEFLIDLLEVRTFIEPAAARLAAQRATPAQILEIERAFRGMAAALPDDIAGCCEHDLAFHQNIIVAARNVVLRRLAMAIRTALLALFKTSANARESYENSLAEHGAVAVAIRSRAPAAAESAMRDLLAGTARDLVPALGPASAASLNAVARPVAKPRGGARR
jgi:GntR family galactonate operon transcriptional repressor